MQPAVVLLPKKEALLLGVKDKISSLLFPSPPPALIAVSGAPITQVSVHYVKSEEFRVWMWGLEFGVQSFGLGAQHPVHLAACSFSHALNGCTVW